MTTRIARTDITDELISPAIKDAILTACDGYLAYLAGIYGKTLADIPAVMPYQVKELGKAWVCMKTCADKSGSGGAAVNGQQPGDKWTSKLPYYQGLVEKYEAAMTEDVLFGTKSAEGIGIIKVGRS